MIIERTSNEIIFRVSNNINLDDLQDIADFLEYSELSKNAKTKQKDVDSLVKTIKKGRWSKTKQIINL